VRADRIVIAAWIATVLALAGGLVLPVAHAENGRWVFPLRFFVPLERGEPIADDYWRAAAVMIANRVFAPADVRFVADDRRSLDDRFLSIVSARQARELAGYVDRTHIDVFVVRTIPAVDEPGAACLGITMPPLHSARPLVVLSTRRDGAVLAHELGHYFGVAHQDGTLMAPYYSDRPLHFDANQLHSISLTAPPLHAQLRTTAP
jgi:hypothetical protein